MDPLYKPQGVEERWQRVWEEEGLYGTEPDPSRRKFVVAHPPPNVTGALHTGHALQISLADALVRWHRMRGFDRVLRGDAPRGAGEDAAGVGARGLRAGRVGVA